MNKANGKWHRFYASAMLFFFAFAQAGEAATTYPLGTGPLVVARMSSTDSGDIVATGIYSGSGSGITVLSGYTGTIMLENVSIDAGVYASITAPISVEPGASPTIVLSGDNRLRGGGGYAGLSVPSGAEVRLTGDGKLTAQGGDFGGGAGIAGGAGIGGGGTGSFGGDGGTVTIVGGGVTATGGVGGAGGGGGAGIGVGGGGVGFGGGGGAGIGGGGTGGVGGGAGGTVTIVGGVVTATGGGGIGGGGAGDGGALTITGGVVWARAGNADVQDIGGASSGTTVITGGSVSADRVRNPRNASQLSFNALLSSDIAGSPGGFASFYVTAPASFIGDYTYVASFDSRRGDTARVWLPTAVASPLPTTSNLLAVADNNLAIALSAGATGGSAYQWQRAASPTGSFGSISGATSLSYNDTGLTNGTTYYYRLLIETSAGSGLYVITSDTVSATARQSGGPAPDPTPVTPPTPTETATEFNDANPGRGIEVTFPTVTLTDLAGVATQLGGLTPNILTPGGITGTTIAPEQENLPNFTGLGRGWGAKIDIQLKSSTATGQIDLLPVGLTFLLSSADLSAANWTDADVVGNTAALLAKAMFAKQQAEGANAGTLQDLTALLTDIVTITRDPSSPGGVRIDFPFLLANGEGAPKVITDNGKKYLVVFDGDRNGWLRDPVWLFRKAIVPTGIALTPTSLSLKKGESGNVTVVYTPTDATERDILWTGQGTVASVTVATVSKSSAADMWVVKGLTEGTVLLTATASADRAKKATLAVTVSPAASELIESVSVSPVPPYHVGTEVDVWVVLKRAPSSVTVSIKRPDGQTDTPTVTIDGTSAVATYTLPELGAYTVTVQATDATGTYSKTASLTVTEREINGDSSSGGCNAGLVPQGLAPGPLMGLIVLALAFARRRWR